MGKTKELKVLMHEKIGFSKLIRALAKVADKDGVLEDFTMTDCVVTGIPQGFPIFRYLEKESSFLFFFKTTVVIQMFMGFELGDSLVTRCTFVARKTKDKK